MSDEDQRHVPPSFLALYSNARGRLIEPLASVRSRYELCEDLANHLVESAQAMHHDLGVSQDEVLARMRRGLAVPESGVAEPEGVWIVTRLAELLGWPLPEADVQ